MEHGSPVQQPTNLEPVAHAVKDPPVGQEALNGVDIVSRGCWLTRFGVVTETWYWK